MAWSLGQPGFGGNPTILWRADGKPVFYDVDAIVAEADGYAANRTAKPTSRNYAGFCHYEYLCDSLSCSYVWVC